MRAPPSESEASSGCSEIDGSSTEAVYSSKRTLQQKQKKTKHAEASATAAVGPPLEEREFTSWRDFFTYIAVYEANTFQVSQRTSSISGAFARV